MDFSALDADAFLVAVGCRGLKTLLLRGSVLPNGFGTDDLIRSSVAQGVFQLAAEDNSDAPRTLSDDVVLDFFFRADAVPARESLDLVLDGYGVNDMFLTRFFEVSTFLVRVCSRYRSRFKLFS